MASSSSGTANMNKMGVTRAGCKLSQFTAEENIRKWVAFDQVEVVWFWRLQLLLGFGKDKPQTRQFGRDLQVVNGHYILLELEFKVRVTVIFKTNNLSFKY